MTNEKRTLVLSAFKNNDTDVLIISLLAGACGINLTSASHVIVFDMWFNPSVEAQCIGKLLYNFLLFTIMSRSCPSVIS